MAATLGLSNMSYSYYPSLYSTMNHASEFSYPDQAYTINGSDQPVGCSDSSCQNLSRSDVPEKPEKIVVSNGNEVIKRKTDVQRCSRIGFRTKSEVDVLDDGFKWRKYGKKAVKNSPNPRNYYRCTMEDCKVKKRVERDKNDPSYVITTYEGVHNHQSPETTVLYEHYSYVAYHGNSSSWTEGASASASASHSF